MHIILDKWLGDRFFKDEAASCGLGYMGHHAPCKDDLGAVSYQTKYMTKMEYDLPKGCRRVQTSQGWPPWKKESEAAWEHVHDIKERDLYEWFAMGASVYDGTLARDVTYDDIENQYYEPEEIRDAKRPRPKTRILLPDSSGC